VSWPANAGHPGDRRADTIEWERSGGGNHRNHQHSENYHWKPAHSAPFHTPKIEFEFFVPCH